MKSRATVFLLIKCFLCIVFLAGCVDPLTQNLKKYGFSAVARVSTTTTIGDLYPKTSTARSPIARAKDYLSQTQIDSILASSSDSTVIPSVSASNSFTLSGSASIIGEATASLQANGVKSFSITYGDPKTYILSEFDWNKSLKDPIAKSFPEAMSSHPAHDYYLITGLLTVDSLQYTLYNQQGAQISVTPGSAIEKVIQGSLGLQWSGSSSGVLTFSGSDPKVVGIQFSKIERDLTLRPTVSLPGVRPRAPLKLQRLELAKGLPPRYE